MIAAHNHSSDNVEQSSEDREITERLRQAGETLGVRLLDHIVFSGAWAAGVTRTGDVAASAEIITPPGGSSTGLTSHSHGQAANSPAPAASGAGMRYYSFLEKGVL